MVPDHESKPLLLHRRCKDNEEPITSNLQSGAMSKSNTLSRSTLPKQWRETDYEDGRTSQQHPIKRSTSKASSILSIETVSTKNAPSICKILPCK